jgi:NADPH-dependent curcumin reductase CurA
MFYYCRIVESKNANYPVGGHFLVRAGWRDKTVMNPDEQPTIAGNVAVQPAIDTGRHPQSLNIGVLGMPGLVQCMVSHSC